MNIEYEGLLYRGDDLSSPGEIWDYPRKRWVAFHDAAFREPGRAISDAEAEALKVNNPAAEHFLYYDIPPWRRLQSEADRDAITPDHMKAAVGDWRQFVAAQRGK